MPGKPPQGTKGVGGPIGEEEIIKIEHLRRVDVKPGDRFVAMVPGPMSVDAFNRFQKIWADFIGSDKIPVLLLVDGMEIGVIRREEE